MTNEKTPQDLNDLIAQAEVQTPQDFDWSRTDEHDAEFTLPILHFVSGEHHYAVNGSDVREILGDLPLTPLPGAPEYVLGVIVHRRQVVGILDLQRWFGFHHESEHTDSKTVRTLIIEHNKLIVGIRTDHVASIEEWSRDDINSVLPQTLPVNVRKYAQATRDVGDHIVLMLDIKRLLEDASIGGGPEA